MVDFVSLFTGMSERDIGFLLKSLVQDSINSELTNAEISEIDNKTQVLITNSKDVELMNDISIQSAINIEPSTVYLMPEEPDGINLKLWLKFQNAGELRDWSYQKNKSYATGANTMPGLFSKYNDHSMMKYELYSYFNGISHYAYTQDAIPVRILPNITASKITSFFMRLVPVSLAKVLYAENNALFTKVDDDQLRYGYSVTVDLVGNLNFYIRNNYVQYHLPVKDAYNYILTDPLYDDSANFRFENFNKKNFLTGFQYLCGLVAAELPFHDWFFKYNPTTHNMSVINTTENNVAAVVADTSLITQLPYLSCPIQEGKYTHSGTVQTTVYDNSGHTNNGTISNIATNGHWNDDNTLTSNRLTGIQIDFPSISTINILTEFTIAFWYNPLNNIMNDTASAIRLVTKGASAASTFSLRIPQSTNNLRFRLENSSDVDTDLIFTNAFTTVNKWYFIVAKWKSGEKTKLYVDNVELLSASNVTTTITNSTDNLRLFSSTESAGGIISLFKFYNIQISQTTQDDLYYQGYHNPLFPKSENIQPVASPTPDPIFVPFTNAYTLDKMTTPVLADYRRINSLAGDTPLVRRYQVDDGVDETDPELNPYSIADGATTAADPFTIIQGPGTAGTTLESSDSSNGILGDVSGGNKRVAMRVKTTGATIGTNIQGKKITRAVYDLRRIGTVTGTVYCKIWNAAGTEVATIGSVAASSLVDGTYGPITFENLSQTVAIPTGSGAVDYRVGVEYTTGASGDEVQVRRKSGDLDASVNQDSWDWSGSSWNSTGNPSFEVKCNLFTGTGTTTLEPNIIMKTGSYSRVAEGFGSTDPLLNKIIGKVTLRLKKVGSPTGTASVVLMNNASTVKATFGLPLDVSTLTTTTADYTFTNYTHGQVALSTDRIAIMWTPSATGEVHVMTNKGNLTSNTWNGNNSAIFKWISSWVADVPIDLAGKIYTGGNNFDAFLRFSTLRTRIAEKAVNSSSDIHNRKINKVVFRAKKTGAPAGIINCYVRDPSDNIKVTFSSVDISTVGTSMADIVFENYSHTYLINSATGSGDKVSVEYSGSSVSDYLQLNTDRDTTGTLNSITQTYDSGNYVDNAQRHVAGQMYEGGEPDLVSRTRVVQSVEHQNSRLKGKKITRVKAFLYRTLVGTAGGTIYCNIRRGIDDSLVKTLGTVGLSGLNTTLDIPSEITFTDTTNNYPLNVGDKVSIEFSGGNSTDQLGVLVRSVTPNYDLSNSYIRKYDEVDYDDLETTMDLCATMDEGGFSFTPDPGSIPDPTPIADKDLVFCAGNGRKSGFFEAFLMEFRIYAKDITLTNANNLYNNRYSISNIGNGEILCPFSLKMNTTDAV